MQKNHLPFFKTISVMLILVLGSCKKESASEQQTEGKLFTKVRTIVQTNCTVSCHAPSIGFPEGLPVILETDNDIIYHAGGIKSAVADPVTPLNKRMPSGGMLSASEIDIIVKWYDGGGTINN